jgi:signal peptidase I
MRSSVKRKETKMRDKPQLVTVQEKSSRRIFQEYSEAFVVAVVLAILIRALLFQAFKIPSGSMEPTLLIGDHILVDKFIYGLRIPFTKDRWPVFYHTIGIPSVRVPFVGWHLFGWRLFDKPRRGDVIVFVYPQNRALDFIKRVVAIPGDTIEIRDGQVIINGKPVKNPNAYYSDNKLLSPSESPRDFMLPRTVPKGKLFVMGDNRDNSYDSRFWGFVPMENVKGEALIIYFSSKNWWPGDWKWNRFFKLIP